MCEKLMCLANGIYHEVPEGSHISESTKKILLEPLVSSGCGAGWLSELACKIIQFIAGVDLTLCCYLHDKGYGDTNVEKSDEHKLREDLNLYLNVADACYRKGFSDKKVDIIAKSWNIMLVAWGDAAYYNDKELTAYNVAKNKAMGKLKKIINK